MSHDQPDMRFDDLDARIRQALRVEVSPRQLAAVERFWREQSLAERRRNRLRRSGALAACVLAASVLLAVFLSTRSARQEPAEGTLEASRPPQVAPTDREVNPVEDSPRPDSPEDPPAVESPREEITVPAGRPANARERFLFIALTHNRRAEEARVAAAAMEEVLERLVEEPDADVEQLAEASGLAQLDAERILLRQLSRGSNQRKHAVLRLLTAYGTPRSTPGLLQISQRDEFRHEALNALEQILGVDQLAGLVRQTADQRVRAEILRRLLEADSDAATRSVLEFIRYEDTRAEALAAISATARPTPATLLVLLDDEEKAVRMSAALTLAHLNGPYITDSLIARVIEEPEGPDEAWLALVACRGARAEQFFAYATSQPKWLGHVNRARARWATMVSYPL